MPILFLLLWGFGFCLGIIAIKSRNWLIVREQNFDIVQGLFETCVIYNKNNQGNQELDQCVDNGAFEKKDTLYTSQVLVATAFCFIIIGSATSVFLSLIGFEKFSWILAAFLNSLAGLELIAACSYFITIPILEQVEKHFTQEVQRLVNPRKVFPVTFYICWISGVLFVCSSEIAVSLAIKERSIAKTKKYEARLYGYYHD